MFDRHILSTQVTSVYTLNFMEPDKDLKTKLYCVIF